MKKWSLVVLAVAIAGLLLAAYVVRSRKSLAGPGSPQCQQCQATAQSTYNQCLINACTSVSGNHNGTACEVQPDQQQRYGTLVQLCAAQQTNSLKLCNNLYGCGF
jgi:hypothetical protein